MSVHRFLFARRPLSLPAAVAIFLGAPACGLSAQHREHRTALEAVSAIDLAPPATEDATAEDASLDAEDGPLRRDALVRAVLARNPNIASAREGWRAVLEGYREEAAVEDPMVEYAFAPVSIGADMRYGQTVTVTQRFAGPGKLRLRRAIVLAEAKAAEHDFAAVQLELALMASVLYDRYYALSRSIAINEEHERHMQEIQAAAVAQYEAGRASQRDPLRAELELSNVLRATVQLRAQQAIVRAEINGLLHRDPASALPPPPKTLERRTEAIESAGARTDTDALEAIALEHRPELQAKQAAIEARRSASTLAKRAFVPDFGVMASYSTMWEELPHRFMLGVSLNLPLQIPARRAGIRRAQAQERQATSELDAATTQVRVDVATAKHRLIEALETVKIYERRTIPVALAQVEAATAAYETGTGSFSDLIEAEQDLRTLQLQAELARAEQSQRYAELERALGRMPGLSASAHGLARDDERQKRGDR